MEREGFKIDLAHMQKIESEASAKIEEKKHKFMKFLMKYQNDKNIDYFNPSSHQQMQQFLHAPFVVKKEDEKAKKVERNIDPELLELEEASLEENIRLPPKR